MKVRSWILVVFLSTLPILSGCNSRTLKPVAAGNDFAALGDPKADLAYATSIPSGSVAESIMRGDAALLSRDLDRALYEYLAALQAGGPNAEVLFKVGRIHLARADRQRAELALGMALGADPDHAGVLLEVGILRMHRRDFANARRDLERVVELGGNAARAHNALGVLADMQGDAVSAQQAYAEAVRLSGKVPAYLNNLGYSHYLIGDTAGAEKWFKAALEQDATHERAWRNLALVYAKTGRYQEALEAFRKTGEVHEAYNDVGYIAMVAGRLDDADRFFDEAIRLSPTFYELAEQNAQRLAVIRDTQASVQ
jgi:Flp pilus assembly protein TadD